MPHLAIAVDQVGRFYVLEDGLTTGGPLGSRNDALKAGDGRFRQLQKAEREAEADEDAEPVRPSTFDRTGLVRMTVSGVDNDVEAEEPDEEVEPEAEGEVAVDLSILDNTVGDLEAALDAGDLDAILDELEAAESAGKNRSTAIEAIADRREAIAE